MAALMLLTAPLLNRMTREDAPQTATK